MTSCDHAHAQVLPSLPRGYERSLSFTSLNGMMLPANLQQQLLRMAPPPPPQTPMPTSASALPPGSDPRQQRAPSQSSQGGPLHRDRGAASAVVSSAVSQPEAVPPVNAPRVAAPSPPPHLLAPRPPPMDLERFVSQVHTLCLLGRSLQQNSCWLLRRSNTAVEDWICDPASIQTHQ